MSKYDVHAEKGETIRVFSLVQWHAMAKKDGSHDGWVKADAKKHRPKNSVVQKKINDALVAHKKNCGCGK